MFVDRRRDGTAENQIFWTEKFLRGRCLCYVAREERMAWYTPASLHIAHLPVFPERHVRWSAQIRDRSGGAANRQMFEHIKLREKGDKKQ